MGRHVGSMQPPVTFKWILALSVVGLLIWACFFSARSSVVTTKTKEIKSTAAGQTVSSESVDEPVLQTVPTAFKSPECTYDLFTYPEWPDNFNVSVNALFLIGATTGTAAHGSASQAVAHRASVCCSMIRKRRTWTRHTATLK